MGGQGEGPAEGTGAPPDFLSRRLRRGGESDRESRRLDFLRGVQAQCVTAASAIESSFVDKHLGTFFAAHAPTLQGSQKKTCLEGDRDLDLLLRFSFLSLSRSLSFDFLQMHCKPWSQHVAKVTGDGNMSS